MFKYFLTSVFLFFLLISSSLAEIIKKVQVNGNQRISKDTILVLSDIKINTEYTNDKLNNSLRKLYDSNFFKDIDFNFTDGSLLITVIENPIIENIEILGLKSENVIEQLYESIVLKNRMSFTENQLKKDIILIKNILKSNGYYFANIKSSLIENNELNSIKINLDITEGERAKIKKISFIGEKKVKDKKLLEVIASEEHKFWKFISNKVYLNRSTINLDKRLLENYYRNLGFYKVNILDSFAEVDKEGNFNLIFNIQSGDKFYFNDLNLNLPEDYNSSDFIEINTIFKKLKGKAYSLNKFNLILDEIDQVASAKLYEFIDAKVTEKQIGKDKINFTFDIVDSEKFYVERVNILGNYTTIEEVIRNRLIVDEGDPLNTLLFNKSVDKIKSLRIFKSVESEIRNGSNDNLKIIDLIVEEQPTGEISLGAGTGTSGTTIGGGIVEKNFLGKGISLNTNLEVSDESLKGQFIYSKPNFAYTDNTLFTSLSATTSDFLSDFGYKTTKQEFSLGTSFEQYENLFFSPETSIAFEELETNSSASTQLKKQKGSYQDFYFNYGLKYDLRDSAYRPSSGNNTFFYQTLPIVSDNNELENTFTFTQYKKFKQSSEMIGKASLYLKAINSIDGSDVRVSKRGQIPQSRLRGFQKGKIGPIDNADYIGGNYVSALNLSTNLPEVLNTIENLDFSYFIDIANVWGVDYDSSLDDSNTIRSSTGVGLDILTPVGPLSFSLSQPITKSSSDKTETFRFNLGTTF
jgi:outer membrane protein insertion porin family